MAQETKKQDHSTEKGVEAMKFEDENFCKSEADIIVNTIKKRCTHCGKCKCKKEERTM